MRWPPGPLLAAGASSFLLLAFAVSINAANGVEAVDGLLLFLTVLAATVLVVAIGLALWIRPANAAAKQLHRDSPEALVFVAQVTPDFDLGLGILKRSQGEVERAGTYVVLAVRSDGVQVWKDPQTRLAAIVPTIVTHVGLGKSQAQTVRRFPSIELTVDDGEGKALLAVTPCRQYPWSLAAIADEAEVKKMVLRIKEILVS